ncbi:MAG: methyltransferase domain-containing protein [Alphaproteobacteria bacterium]|nr:methyltransferase domain-containing protein [Alphaproteobacteria bacterium]
MTRPPPQIFDRRLYAQHRARSDAAEFLVADAAQNIAERISAWSGAPQLALDLSSRPASFAQLRDMAGMWIKSTPGCGLPSSAAVVADEEAIPFGPQSFHLITSVLSLHAVNDLPGALIQIRHALKPGGLFVGALLGGETLSELRDSFAAAESEVTGGITPRVAPFADVRDIGALLQRAGFMSPVSDVERTTVGYRDFFALVSDLRTLGETNVMLQRSQQFLRRDVLRACLAHYQRSHSDQERRLRATFDVVYLTGWGPSEPIKD